MKDTSYGMAHVLGAEQDFELLVEYRWGILIDMDYTIYFEEGKDIITGEKIYRKGHHYDWSKKNYWNNPYEAIKKKLAKRRKLISIAIKNISPEEMKEHLNNMSAADINNYCDNVQKAKANYTGMINSAIEEEKRNREDKSVMKKSIKKKRRELIKSIK